MLSTIYHVIWLYILPKRCICIIFTIFTYKFTHQPSTDGNGRDPWDTIGDPHGYIKNFMTIQMSLRLFCLLPGFVLNDSITQRLSIFHHNLWTKIKIILINFKKKFSLSWMTFFSSIHHSKDCQFQFLVIKNTISRFFVKEQKAVW